MRFEDFGLHIQADVVAQVTDWVYRSAFAVDAVADAAIPLMLMVMTFEADALASQCSFCWHGQRQPAHRSRDRSGRAS